MSITHFVIDFETMGLRENAIPLSLGITAFRFGEEPNIKKLKEESVYIKFHQKSILEAKKHSVDQSTVLWWKQQSKDVINATLAPSDKDLTIEKAVEIINAFFRKHDYSYNESYIWSRGIDFDLPKFRYLYAVLGQNYPFNPFKNRDIRTYVDILAGTNDGQYKILKGDTYFDKHLPKHIAVSDTIRDAYIMQELFII